MDREADRNSELVTQIKKHWDMLIDRGQFLTYRPGQYLFYEGHQALGAYLLCKGTISLSKLNDPSFQKSISADSQPIVGMDYLVTGDKFDYSARALIFAELCYLPKSEILKLFPKKNSLNN